MKFYQIVACILLSLSNLAFAQNKSKDDLKFCAAIRGNGTYIYSHFGSIARVVEEYGEFDALSGGSSAAVSAFLYESIAINPALKGLSPETRASYISLMFKSMSGFLKFLSSTEEAAAIGYLSSVANRVETENIYGLFKIEWLKAAKRLYKILNDEESKLSIPRVLTS